MQTPDFNAAPSGAMTRRTVPVLNRLTGIRAIAALFVVTLHYGDAVAMLFPGFRYLRPVYRAGGNGVDLFFILSGFILCHNYLDQFQALTRRDYFRFLRARLARIYPVQLATLLCLTAIVLLAMHAGKPLNREHYSLARWVANLLLLQTWPPLGNSLSWNYPAWSVSAEWFAYLLFPLLARWIFKARQPALWAMFCLSLYALPASFGWVHDGAPSNAAVLRVLAEFLYGSFLYRLYQARTRCPVSPFFAGLLSLAATLACSFLGWTPVAAVPFYGILLWSLAAHPEGPLGGRISVYLGQASYSLYMTHGVVQIVLNRLAPAERFVHASLLTRCCVLSGYAALIAAAAALTYHLVEVPGRKALLGHLLKRRKPATTTTAPLSPPIAIADAK